MRKKKVWIKRWYSLRQLNFEIEKSYDESGFFPSDYFY